MQPGVVAECRLRKTELARVLGKNFPRKKTSDIPYIYASQTLPSFDYKDTTTFRAKPPLA
jgi:hypothetical protein